MVIYLFVSNYAFSQIETATLFLDQPLNQYDSLGNKTGYWKEYDSLNNFSGIKIYNNYGSYFYSPEIVIYNNSKYIIKRLYHQPSDDDFDFEKDKLNEYFFRNTWGFLMCLSNDSCIFKSSMKRYERYLMIKNDNVELLENYKSDSFSSGYSNFINNSDKYLVEDNQFEIGKVNIEFVDDICTDTQHSEIEITCIEGNIRFVGTRNVSIFEFDIDNDGNKEMLIFSYHSCNRKVDIYKISKFE